MASSWNSHFHQNKAYDTSYSNDGQGMPIPEPQVQQNQSYPYGTEKSYENDNINNNNNNNNNPIETQPNFTNNVEINNSERHSSSSFPLWSTSPPKQSIINFSPTTENNKDFNSSTPITQYENNVSDKYTESDEELAKRLYREETANYYRDSMSSRRHTGGTGGTGDFYNNKPIGEASTYYSAAGERGQTTSGIPVQATAISPEKNPNQTNPYIDPLIEKKKKKTNWKPYFTWLVTAIQLVVFILEFVKNQELYGTAIQTNPLNPMIGPSSMTLIQLGARFNPCMRNVTIAGTLDTTYAYECPPKLQNELNGKSCTLEVICGLGGFKSGFPDQWYRFITPIFLHAGVIHFLFNMLFQWITGKSVESEIGWWRYGIIYMASGIFGFVFGGNFAEPTIPSMGASGALFGVIGILLLSILQNWKLLESPVWELTKMVVLIVISFLIGLLPGLDNFSHIGGFIMGILTGLILLPTIDFSKFHKWANWILRIVAIPIVVLLYFFLIKNFYTDNPTEKCPWCKYLSCLPVLGWCDQTGIKKV